MVAGVIRLIRLATPSLHEANGVAAPMGLHDKLAIHAKRECQHERRVLP